MEEAVEEEALVLTWNDHTQVFNRILAALRHQEVFSDVTLVCGVHRYAAHKFVLSTCSSYFDQVLEAAGVDHPVLVFPETCPEAVSRLLDFMYLGQAEVPAHDLDSLLNVAYQLRVKGFIGFEDNPDLRDARKSDPKEKWQAVQELACAASAVSQDQQQPCSVQSHTVSQPAKLSVKPSRGRRSASPTVKGRRTSRTTTSQSKRQKHVKQQPSSKTQVNKKRGRPRLQQSIQLGGAQTQCLPLSKSNKVLESSQHSQASQSPQPPESPELSQSPQPPESPQLSQVSQSPEPPESPQPLQPHQPPKSSELPHKAKSSEPSKSPQQSTPVNSKLERKNKKSYEKKIKPSNRKDEARRQKPRDSTKQWHQCQLCDCSFLTTYELECHKQDHQASNLLSCPECPFRTRVRSTLTQHINKHKGLLLYECPHCPATHQLEQQHVDHQRRTHPARPITVNLITPRTPFTKDHPTKAVLPKAPSSTKAASTKGLSNKVTTTKTSTRKTPSTKVLTSTKVTSTRARPTRTSSSRSPSPRTRAPKSPLSTSQSSSSSYSSPPHSPCPSPTSSEDTQADRDRKRRHRSLDNFMPLLRVKRLKSDYLGCLGQSGPPHTSLKLNNDVGALPVPEPSCTSGHRDTLPTGRSIKTVRRHSREK